MNSHIWPDLDNARRLVQVIAVRESQFIFPHDAFVYIVRQFNLSRGLMIAFENDTPPGCCCLPVIAP